MEINASLKISSAPILLKYPPFFSLFALLFLKCLFVCVWGGAGCGFVNFENINMNPH